MISKVDQFYWDRGWKELGDLPPPIDPRSSKLRDHWKRSFCEFFEAWIPKAVPERGRLIEVGCARSVWLPYFAKSWGYQVAGLDSSEIGCRQAEAILKREGVKGTIYHADLFRPPEEVLEAFDVVISFGLVEHFWPTSQVVRALGRFLKPGGIMVTVVPNMSGIVGSLQRLLNSEVFRMHVVLSACRLRKAHEEAGLRVEFAGYHMVCNFGVLNAGTRSWGARRAVLALLRGISLGLWFLERKGFRQSPGRLLSPYVGCVASRRVRDGLGT
jgi:2-polyprenyl-3-methyl-5-hydroxy-6-metoxy-1,4-benzoquinol methylase